MEDKKMPWDDMPWIKGEKYYWRECKPLCLEVRRKNSKAFLLQTMDSLIDDALLLSKILDKKATYKDDSDKFMEWFEEEINSKYEGM